MSEVRKELYSIGDIAKLANLSVYTIRAWERRYAVVQPVRSPGGTRRYSSEHLRRLQRLKAVVEAGHRIGDVAHLSELELGNLACAVPSGSARGESDGQATKEAVLDLASVSEIIERATCLDALGVERLLNVQYRLLGPSTFRRTLCPEILTRIGELWRQGQFAIASEHLVSESLTRLLMRSLDGRTPGESAPVILFSTPQGETHRLGLLIAAGVASDAGAHVINLGSDMPSNALVQAVQQAKPWAVAISVVNMDVGSQRGYLQTVRRAIPEAVEVWIGGARALGDLAGCIRMNLGQMDQRIKEYCSNQ